MHRSTNDIDYIFIYWWKFPIWILQLCFASPKTEFNFSILYIQIYGSYIRFQKIVRIIYRLSMMISETEISDVLSEPYWTAIVLFIYFFKYSGSIKMCLIIFLTHDFLLLLLVVRKIKLLKVEPDWKKRVHFSSTLFFCIMCDTCSAKLSHFILR